MDDKITTAKYSQLTLHTCSQRSRFARIAAAPLLKISARCNAKKTVVVCQDFIARLA